MGGIFLIGMMQAYRIGRKMYKARGNSRVVRKWMNFFNLLYNCHISAECQIGKDTRLGYGGLGIVIHDKCRIGNDCVIAQNVTLGGKGNIPGGKVRKIHKLKNGGGY